MPIICLTKHVPLLSSGSGREPMPKPPRLPIAVTEIELPDLGDYLLPPIAACLKASFENGRLALTLRTDRGQSLHLILREPAARSLRDMLFARALSETKPSKRH